MFINYICADYILIYKNKYNTLAKKSNFSYCCSAEPILSLNSSCFWVHAFFPKIDILNHTKYMYQVIYHQQYQIVLPKLRPKRIGSRYNQKSFCLTASTIFTAKNFNLHISFIIIIFGPNKKVCKRETVTCFTYIHFIHIYLYTEYNNLFHRYFS